MKYKFRNNLSLLITFSPLIIALFLVILSPSYAKRIWEFLDEKNIDIIKNQTLFKYVSKEILFFLGVGYLIIFFFYWVFKERKNIFTPTDNKFRTISVFLLGLSIPIWLYARTNVLLFTIMGLLVIYGIKNKQKYRLSKSTIFLLLYVILQFVGILWKLDVFQVYFWKYPANITNQLMILAPIVALCVFRFTTREKNLFISILFKFFFLYIILHLTSYILLSNYYDKNIFSCFVFNKRYLINKGYLMYTDVFQFSEYRHPSMISNLLIIIGAISYVNYKNNSSWISRKELILYWIITLFFVFIVQARVAQVGYFVVLAFIFFFDISKRISRKKQISIILLGVLLFFVGIYGMINFTSFFNDPARTAIYNEGLKSIKTNNLLLGAGTYSEMIIFEKMDMLKDGTVHYHNDFLQAMAKYGIIGFSLLLLWIITAFRSSLKDKRLDFFFFLLPTLLFMLTDTALNHYRILIVNAVFLFVFLEKEIDTDKRINE